MRRLKTSAGLAALLISFFAKAQPTFPENGVADPRHGQYAFTNATIIKDASTTLNNATLIIKDGKIIARLGNAEDLESQVAKGEPSEEHSANA